MIGDPSWRRGLQVRVARHRKRRSAAPKPDVAATPHDRLVWAAQNGQFETLVDEARPAEPLAMVTPEEREAELRAAGRWPADKPKPVPAPPSAPEAEPERELTPNEQYIAEHCRWTPRRRSSPPRHHREGRCLTEYNPLTGEIIGDGYIHYDDEDEDDAW